MNRFVYPTCALLALCAGSALAQNTIPASNLIQVGDPISLPGHGTQCTKAAPESQIV